MGKRRSGAIAVLDNQSGPDVVSIQNNQNKVVPAAKPLVGGDEDLLWIGAVDKPLCLERGRRNLPGLIRGGEVALGDDVEQHRVHSSARYYVVYMRLFTSEFGVGLVFFVLIFGACTPSVSSNPPAHEASHPCRNTAGLVATGSETTELVLAGVRRAQANDLRCGTPDNRTRICRALFLVATLDPALHLYNQSLRQQVGDALSWALGDATAVAPPHLADAFETLTTTNRTLTTAGDERSILDALVLRSQPVVTDTIDQHWRNDCV